MSLSAVLLCASLASCIILLKRVLEFFKSFDFAFTLFNSFNSIQFSSVQLVRFCLVSLSLVCSFQFVNKWIHSFIEQCDQGEAAAKIDSFMYDRQLTKLVIATLHQ